jgi:peptidoglycan lytic transglycosylase
MAALLAGVVSAACSTPPSKSGPPHAEAPAPREGATQTGRASWYGEPHHGRRTASGEVFDMHRLTAAHPTLPFGTRLLVTNLANHRSVEVRVNDRGPFAGGRIIDLSYAAALALHAVNAGVFAVRVAVIER